jgi:mono/diheme cytochrome c family protein
MIRRLPFLLKETRSMRNHLKLLLLLGLVGVTPARGEVDKKAERNFKGKCASCHGADGKGQTDQGKKMQVEDMSSAAWQKKTDAQIKKAIEDGAKKGDAVMEGYKDKLDAASIDALVAYVRTLKK